MIDSCVIFDIDGTLVNSGAFEGRSYVAAVRDVLGNVSIRPDWSYEHVTDSGILRQICDENGVAAEQCEQQVRTRFGGAHGGLSQPTWGMRVDTRRVAAY